VVNKRVYYIVVSVIMCDAHCVYLLLAHEPTVEANFLTLYCTIKCRRILCDCFIENVFAYCARPV